MARINGISIENLLDLQVMEYCKLIAGFRGSKNTISRVNIMADPDIIEWTRPGEFLLTTAYFFEEDNVKEQEEFIRQCADKKLAGVGIKVSPYLERLSEEMLGLANDLSFPVIDIHYSVPLSDIMTDAFKEIFNKQASLLERMEKVHEKLMEAILKGNGLSTIIGIVQENIKNPVMLRLSPTADIFESMDEKTLYLRDDLVGQVEGFYEKNNYKNQLKELIEDRVLIDGRYIRRMIMPIILRGKIYGHIFFWSLETPLGGFDLSIIESAATTISLFILQKMSIKEVEIRYSSEYFEDLISIDLKRKKKALDRANFFNLKIEDYYIVEVMSIKDKKKNFDCTIEYNYLDEYLNPIVNNIEELIDYLNLTGIVSTKLNGIQILLSFKDKARIERCLDEFNERLLECIFSRNNDLEIKIGVGRSYRKLENVDKSFQDAVRAVRIGKVITSKDIIKYDQLGIFKILSQDFLLEELEDFYESTLKALADYDEKKSTDLVATLHSYFDNNGNLTRVSERLFAHYNTILYRMKRIEEITGMDLNDSTDRLNLEIAIKIKELLEK